MPKEESYFIQRLYNAIQEHRSSIVDWDSADKGFIVGNFSQFTNQVLLRKFGIGRLDNFARKVPIQDSKLNKYGFKRSKIDKNKIRFFHKYFNCGSKYIQHYNRNLHKIKKLTKQQSLPKHIKLKLIREQLNKKNSSSSPQNLTDIAQEILDNQKVKDNQYPNSPQSQFFDLQEELSQNFKSLIKQKENNNKQPQSQNLKMHGKLWKTCNSFHDKSPEKVQHLREEQDDEKFNNEEVPLFFREFSPNANNYF